MRCIQAERISRFLPSSYAGHGNLVRAKPSLLLLLAAPTWLWGRCGRHNSPPASSVMDLVFSRSDGSHVSVDTVHPSLLRSSSLSSPGWYHLQSLSSDVVLVSPLYVAKPPESRFPAPLCDTLKAFTVDAKLQIWQPS